MSLRYLLDTNILSEPMKPSPNRGLMRRLHQHEGALAISSITWHEALYGLHRMPAGKRRDQVGAYISTVIGRLPVLPYDTAAADWHAKERARMAARGKSAPFADGQIAAIAHVHSMTLVTANEKDFAWFEGLAVENWLR